MGWPQWGVSYQVHLQRKPKESTLTTDFWRHQEGGALSSKYHTKRLLSMATLILTVGFEFRSIKRGLNLEQTENHGYTYLKPQDLPLPQSHAVAQFSKRGAPRQTTTVGSPPYRGTNLEQTECHRAWSNRDSDVDEAMLLPKLMIKRKRRLSLACATGIGQSRQEPQKLTWNLHGTKYIQSIC